MKRQIVAMFLVGGLVLGLCGCGGSSGSSEIHSNWLYILHVV